MKNRSEYEKTLLTKAQQFLPGGSIGNLTFTGDHAMVIERGEGSRVWDFSGNEYVDYLLGSGPMVLGHANKGINQVIMQYLDRGSTYFVENEPAILLAEELCNAFPCADKVRYATSGTEATFNCLRIARAFKKRDKILKFEGAYHGMHDYAVQSLYPGSRRTIAESMTNNPKKSDRNPGTSALSDIIGDLPDYPTPVPDVPGIPKETTDSVLIAPFNDIQTASEIILKYRHELAAVIVEPMQRIIPPKPGFLEGLRKITQENDIVLIFDEVVTGLRLAYGGAQEYYGVVPDLMATAKIAGGGTPLSVIAGKRDLMDLYDPTASEEDYILQVGTFAANPISCVAALETIRQMKEPGVYQQMFSTGRTIRSKLDELLSNAEIPHQIIGEDVLFDVFFTDRTISNYRDTLLATNEAFEKENRAKWNTTLLENGILKGGNKMYIGYCHNKEDIDITTSAFSKAIDVILP